MLILRTVNRIHLVLCQNAFFSEINAQCEGYDENDKYWKAPLKLKGCVCEVTFETDAEIFQTYFAYLVFPGQCSLLKKKKPKKTTNYIL